MCDTSANSHAPLQTKIAHLWTEVVLDIVPENWGDAGHKSCDVLDTDFTASVGGGKNTTSSASRGAFRILLVLARGSHAPQELDDRREMAVNLQPEQRRERPTNLREKAREIAR